MQLFNNYTDQAGYYDLSLLIYNAADFGNARVINETWENLITETHYENEQRLRHWELVQAGRPLPDGVQPPTGEPPLPYESVSTQIQNIAHRTSLDSLIFPVDTLLPLVCGYAINNGQDASIGADPCWPILLFLHLGVPHALITRVLEGILDAQEAPFTGRRRKVVAQWINLSVETWVRDVERRGAAGKVGDSAISGWVADLLDRVDEALVTITSGIRNQAEADEVLDIRRSTRALRRSVESLAAAEAQGSLYR